MAWQKGQSGNPGGYSKAHAEVSRLARECSEEVIKRLKAIASKSKNEIAAIRAGEVLLDRGFGRPAQTLTHENPDGSPLSIVIATAIPAADEAPADPPAVH